jgi:hypothetical protein
VAVIIIIIIIIIIIQVLLIFMTVGMISGYRLDVQGVGVRVPVGSRIFTFSCPDWLWGPPNLVSSEYQVLSPRGVKRPELEVDDSPLNSTKGKRTRFCTTTP